MKDIVVRYWLESLLAGLCSIAFALYRKLSARVKKEVEEQNLIKEGLLAMLHDRLYQGCRFYLRQGCIDVEGLKNIEYLYISYHELGGNGTGTELYNRVKRLPINESEE